ncbi:hypothetical protein HDU85_004992 [Gaertneriomyces sp. JEL0708]|nr:hypothetical protein HDU85_004992 [Gaertneriomyces sp. JEL0708]
MGSVIRVNAFQTSRFVLKRDEKDDYSQPKKNPGWRSAFMASAEEDKQRGKKDRVQAVQWAKEGWSHNALSGAAKAGLDAKQRQEDPESQRPPVRTDKSYISDSAPRPILGLEDQIAGGKPNQETTDFVKKHSK